MFTFSHSSPRYSYIESCLQNLVPHHWVTNVVGFVLKTLSQSSRLCGVGDKPCDLSTKTCRSSRLQRVFQISLLDCPGRLSFHVSLFTKIYLRVSQQTHFRERERDGEWERERQRENSELFLFNKTYSPSFKINTIQWDVSHHWHIQHVFKMFPSGLSGPWSYLTLWLPMTVI